MDLPLMSALRGRGVGFGVAAIAFAAALHAAWAFAAGYGRQTERDVDVKAAFIYSFAKFAEWPLLASGAPIVFCIVGSEQIASALAGTVRGRHVGGHALDVAQPRDSAGWRRCSVLFIADAEIGQSADRLSGVANLPILTVSDGRDFARSGGIIELYVENGRMRFVINVDAVELSGVRLSSRLLGLAKIVRGVPAR
jgi:hypothetical protein